MKPKPYSYGTNTLTGALVKYKIEKIKHTGLIIIKKTSISSQLSVPYNGTFSPVIAAMVDGRHKEMGGGGRKSSLTTRRQRDIMNHEGISFWDI